MPPPSRAERRTVGAEKERREAPPAARLPPFLRPKLPNSEAAALPEEKNGRRSWALGKVALRGSGGARSGRAVQPHRSPKAGSEEVASHSRLRRTKPLRFALFPRPVPPSFSFFLFFFKGEPGARCLPIPHVAPSSPKRMMQHFN